MREKLSLLAFASADGSHSLTSHNGSKQMIMDTEEYQRDICHISTWFYQDITAEWFYQSFIPIVWQYQFRYGINPED